MDPHGPVLRYGVAVQARRDKWVKIVELLRSQRATARAGTMMDANPDIKHECIRQASRNVVAVVVQVQQQNVHARSNERPS